MKTLPPRFTWIPLGVEGGLDESSLSSHLLAPLGSTSFVCLDAGTIWAGLKAASKNGCFTGMQLKEDPGLNAEGTILHHHIKAYLITHPFLDHVEGLIVISPNDNSKPVIGLRKVIDDIENHLFNWRIWPNFGKSGAAPVLGRYPYVTLQPGEKTPIADTLINVEAHPLAHGEYTDSTAFLIESSGAYILYMGDTGPDEVEKRTTTEDLWKHIAPLIREQRLHGIFIEASYPDERPDDQLFSHLTPAWLIKAFRKLAVIVNPQNPQSALQGFRVIITHIKPDLSSGVTPRETIEKQLNMHNDLGLDFIFAKQGKRYEL